MKDENGTSICCFNCRFSEWLGGPEGHLDSKMNCRRYAPRKTHGVGTGSEKGMWPVMGMKDWCGEFKSRFLSVSPTDNQSDPPLSDDY